MTELLRQALREAPSIYAICKATDLEISSLLRFRDGQSSLRLDKADILAKHLGIRVSRGGRK